MDRKLCRIDHIYAGLITETRKHPSPARHNYNFCVNDAWIVPPLQPPKPQITAINAHPSDDCAQLPDPGSDNATDHRSALQR